ncbi:MAG: transposase [Bacteroidales bacterium]|nr:transposase [Bacteroidales bacterium]
MKKRTKEEKEKILHSVQSLGVVAGCRRYGVEPSTYYTWLEKYQAHGIEGLEDRRGKQSEAALKRLEKENKILKEILAEKDLELKMKDELLKKKMVHWKREKK